MISIESLEEEAEYLRARMGILRFTAENTLNNNSLDDESYTVIQQIEEHLNVLFTSFGSLKETFIEVEKKKQLLDS